MNPLNISVIIMTLNAESTLPFLLDRLHKQTCPPCEIIVVDSCSEDRTPFIALAAGAKVVSVKRVEFDHGKSRDLGVKYSIGNIICFLTQDALPLRDDYLEKLTSPFIRGDVACVYGRQISRPDAAEEVKLTQTYNYPPLSAMRTAADLPEMGIKTYFMSDVCSAYSREAYCALGGFKYPIITNEDMLIAARFIHAGYTISYCAEAIVEHSHRFNLKQDYRRSFDIGVFLRMHASAMPGASANTEGIRYVLTLCRALISDFHLISLVRFILHCCARFIGHRAGWSYRRLPMNMCKAMSNNKNFWDNVANSK